MGSSVAQTFACQYVAAGGLNWEGSYWRTREFRVEEPFFLTLTPDGKGLSVDTVEKQLLSTAPTCVTEDP